MKKIFIFVFCLCCSSTYSQISTDEQPISFRISPNILKEDGQIDARTMPQLDMVRIQEEDEEDEKTGNPPRFGFPHSVHLDLENSGTWTYLPNGDKIWRLKINCPGALSINLLYDKFWLPEKAKFFVYSNNKKYSLGAFTSLNNKGGRDDVQGFATGLVYSDKITLEYYLPKDVEEIGLISIAYVVHGYRYIYLSGNAVESFEGSGGCQVNVNCPEGANWQQEKNAVALILVNGTRYCTGSLVNTTCNDNAPLFLTADHCIPNNDAISNPNLSNYSFYWNYESPTCSNPSSEPPKKSTVGATVIANNSNSDFALLRLTEDPRNRTGVTPYYLGWDRSGSAGTGGVGIHHPRGDIKKIATYTGTPVNSTCMNSNYWQTGFVATTSGHSVMEPVSSGSPLINSNHKVIGQLYGPGNTALCPPYQCDNPSLQQVSYGKFSVSWNGGGATDSRRRLSDWLDPLGTAPTTLDGKAASATVITGPSGPVCSSATYSLSGVPTGATVTWSATPSGIVTLSPSGSSVTVTRVPLTKGPVKLEAQIVTSCSSFTKFKNIHVGDPVATSLLVQGDSYLSPAPIEGNYEAMYDLQQLCYSNIPGVEILEVEWSVSTGETVNTFGSSWCSGGIVPGSGATIYFGTPGTRYIYVRARNACGWSEQTIGLMVDVYAWFVMEVSPNPANGYISVRSRNTEEGKSLEAAREAAGEFNVRLYNGQGRLLREAESENGSVRLDTQELPEGTHYLHITRGKETVKRQVVIKH